MNIDRPLENMSRVFYQVVNYFLAADVPWHFRLLLIMVIMFFAGGLYLDSLASKISLELPKLETELTVDDSGSGAAGKGSVTSLHIDALKEHTKNKLDNVSSSAKLLYDFSKIALGALLASLSSAIKDIKAPKARRKPLQMTPNRDK